MRFFAALMLICGFLAAAPAKVDAHSARLRKAFRKPPQNGWIFVPPEGSPSDVGFQHGYLLAPEIADAQRAIKLALTHDSKDWQYFRAAAENTFWPHIEGNTA